MSRPESTRITIAVMGLMLCLAGAARSASSASLNILFIYVEGADSSAQLVVRDGSTIALNGDSELVLPSQAGKQLSLRRGAPPESNVGGTRTAKHRSKGLRESSRWAPGPACIVT